MAVVQNAGAAMLREKMERKRLTRAALAPKVETTAASVSRWASGDRVPAARARIALHKVMGIPIGAWDQHQ